MNPHNWRFEQTPEASLAGAAQSPIRYTDSTVHKARAKRFSLFMALASLPIFLPSCMCTAESRPGLRMEILDATTQKPIGEEAHVVATDGSFEETLGTFDGRMFAGVNERKGKYLISVAKPGYETWQETVKVRRGACHVKTVELTVELEKVT